VWTTGGKVPVPAALAKNKQGILIGDNVYSGRITPIYMRNEDRDTHLNIVGKTKVGKSTFMHNLINQDIAAGRGVGVIDPHGKLISDILRCSIPDSRIDDVVIIDIADEEFPPPLNPMMIPGARGQSAANQLVAIMDAVYGGFDKTTRIGTLLSAALVTLWQEQTPTVRDISRLFKDTEYRHKLLNQLDDELSWDFWKEEFESLSPGRREEFVYPVLYRIRTFFGNPILYPIMCHPRSLDFAKLISSGKIILVSLKVDEEKIPPREQRLLGAVLVSQLQMAATKSWKGENTFYLYIDEAQYFGNRAKLTLLSSELAK
jgi:hypothetical protein